MQRAKSLVNSTDVVKPLLKAGDLLEPTIGFLFKSGLSKKQLLAECRSAIHKASTTKLTLSVVHVGFRKETIDIVNRWLRDPSYLNHNGRPDDLPLTGPRSIGSLVKACRVAVRPDKALAQLLEFDMVKRVASRKYRLVRRLMDFAHSDYLPFEPNFRFLVDATRAATNRLQDSKATNRLFWQCADNPRIHPRHTKEFLDFVRHRGLSFVHEINDWLDEHETVEARIPKNRTQLKRLGVGLFGIGSNKD